MLDALTAAPFEPLQDVDLKFLSLKTALLAAAWFQRNEWEICQLCPYISLALQFLMITGELLCSWTMLEPCYHSRLQVCCHRPGCICSPPFQSEEEMLHTLCQVCAFSIHGERTRTLGHSEQLFVCYVSQTLGEALSKEHLSKWIVEAITLAYSAKGKVPREGLRAHSTKACCCFLLGHAT